jgi:hypothetical protein
MISFGYRLNKSIMTKFFYIEGLGDVRVTKYRRSKRIKILVNQQSEVKVSIPYYVSYKRGLSFVKEKLPWIQQSQNRMMANSNQKKLLGPGYSFDFLDKKLSIKTTQEPWISTQIRANEIILACPSTVDYQEEENQQLIESLIIEVLRKEAKKYLPVRVEMLAGLHGFEYSGVAIKNLRSRWGSCSGTNNINLNLHLVRLPVDLIDYVILHELVHTKHKNHSIHFWNALGDVLNKDAKKYRKKMQNYHPTL